MKTMSVITLCTLAAGMAVAQSGDMPKQFDELDVEKQFDQLDIDKSGQISTYEAEADMKLLEQFNRLDGNGDGRLNRAEFAAFKEQDQ